MDIVLWGVRGTIPNPDSFNTFYGANTACVTVRPSPDLLLIFDAGTGIYSLGKTLPDTGECHIFISHAHSDHVQGLTFFRPFCQQGWTIHLYMPPWLEDLPLRIFDGQSFPIPFADLPAAVSIHTIQPGTDTVLKSAAHSVHVESFPTNHPGNGLAYKVVAEDTVFLYSGDHELSNAPDVRKNTAAMLEKVDLALVDATYTRETLQPGWGHSAWEDWADAAKQADVSTLILSHHMQNATDAELDALQREALRHCSTGTSGIKKIAVGREGMRISLPGALEIDYKTSDWLRSFVQSLSQYKEESALLDRILHKSREISNADAGSFYLTEGDELVFAYSQNDTLFPKDNNNKSLYVTMRMPITTSSIAGFVAATNTVLNLPDVHCIAEDTPYRFNDSFDIKTGYTTRSMLTIPITGHNNAMLGVLQLINSVNPHTQKIQPFSEVMIADIQACAREAGTFLARSAKISENIHRLLRAAMLHDPMETGPHAERVGSIAAEVYQAWATQKGIDPERIRLFKSQLRLAAMLHDIGKVGISDLVLKKPAKLTDEEFIVMQSHTVLGGGLFTGSVEDIEALANEIALNHHQKWNGKGYPVIDGTPMSGESIPLGARITAIADVFDALVSPRCYKEPWSFERAANLLREEAGNHFDPELVGCFVAMLDTIAMIYERYPDNHGQQ